MALDLRVFLTHNPGMENAPDSLTVLTVSRLLLATKSYVRDGDAIGRMPMKMAKRFRVSQRNFTTIFELADILENLNSDPRSLVIRGEPVPGLDVSQPVRRLKYSDPNQLATFRSSPIGQRWICFDFDKVACPAGIDPKTEPATAIKHLISLLPGAFHGVTCWAQWSSSAGIKGWSQLSAHIWFVLDRPITDDELWLWGQSTSAPIDIRLFNAVQPHFTAAPIFAFDVPDPCPNRFMLIEGAADVAQIRAAGADGCRRDAGHPEATRPQSARDGTAPRPQEPRPAPANLAMGSGRTHHRASRDSGSVLPSETPLLSERLAMQFRQRFN
ncbi:hypothetical protein RPMA_12465 [Tardiphaga alba]|uniref:Uncharacterized protein n=1 Tax=Tardiphaga alba TaxID=340268 RepID=A0ABX8AA67_9BRAD|nr:hypothetical protein [Tardiphaga alba]QUS39559.1 hypothetical protein RPMA_12465 [Tardiphaga alba]